MKVSVIVEDMAPAIHMGTSVDRRCRQFELGQEIAGYIVKNQQPGMQAVISLILVDESKEPDHE